MASTRDQQQQDLMNTWTASSPSLAIKLAAIGNLYLTLYPRPVYFGPFDVHTNQELAKLLKKLDSVTDEKAYQELIQTLYALPNSSYLGKLLLQCISAHQLLPMHVNPYARADALDTADKTYDLLLRHQEFSGDFNKGIANALSKLKTYTAPAAVPVITRSRDGNVADALAEVGDKYLAKYKNPQIRFCFFSYHTHQSEAKLLSELRGKSDQEAIKLAGQLLLRISKGELSQGMMETVVPKFEGAIDKDFAANGRRGSYEQQIAGVLLRMVTEDEAVVAAAAATTASAV